MEKPSYKRGDMFRIPKEHGCGHIGEIIQILDDGKIVVKCRKDHREDPFTKEPFKGYDIEGKSIPKRNIVYIINPR